MPRFATGLAIAITAFAISLCAAASQSDDGPQPNIIVVLVDDLGWMDLGCQGSDFYQTPNIDRLAAGGMRFTNGYSACAVCSPTRAALMTGRYPHRIGITDWIKPAHRMDLRRAANCELPGFHDSGRAMLTAVNRHQLPLQEVTIAELLAELGYKSCFIGKWHLGGEGFLPTDQGFDVQLAGCDQGQPPSYFDPYVNRRLPDGIPTLPPRRAGEYLTDREADEAVAFIRANHARPFLLYLSHYAVHTPIQAKQALVEKHKSRKDGRGQDNAKYAAMIESVDDSVGRVLDALDEFRLTQNTMIFFTSDNGGLDRDGNPTDNAPLRSGKSYAHEGGIRVPWIVRWPGVTEAGSTSDEAICSVDLFPTIAAAVGVDLATDRVVDGIDVRTALEGNRLPDRALYWHFPHYRRGPGHDPYSIIRQGDWKLIVTYDPPGMALHHLGEDMEETRDYRDGHPEVVQRLRAALDLHLREAGAIIPRPAEAASTETGSRSGS